MLEILNRFDLFKNQCLLRRYVYLLIIKQFLPSIPPPPYAILPGLEDRRLKFRNIIYFLGGLKQQRDISTKWDFKKILKQCSTHIVYASQRHDSPGFLTLFMYFFPPRCSSQGRWWQFRDRGMTLIKLIATTSHRLFWKYMSGIDLGQFSIFFWGSKLFLLYKQYKNYSKCLKNTFCRYLY